MSHQLSISHISAALKNVASERLSCSHVSGICQKRLNVPAALSMLRLCRGRGRGRGRCKRILRMRSSWQYSLGCNEFIFYSTFIWLTLFSLYFSILRTICFLTFFDSRPPSFAKLTFCRFKFSKEAVGTKFGYFLSEYFLGTNCMPL